MGLESIYATPAFRNTLRGVPTAVMISVDFSEFKNPVPVTISSYAAIDHFFGQSVNSPAT